MISAVLSLLSRLTHVVQWLAHPTSDHGYVGSSCGVGECLSESNGFL